LAKSFVAVIYHLLQSKPF